MVTSEMILDVDGGLGPDFFFPHLSGRVLSIAVTNQSSRVWTGFEIELQSFLRVPSTPFDGLSFGKIRGADDTTIDLFPPTAFQFAPLLDDSGCKVSNGYVPPESKRRFPCSDRFQQVSFDQSINSVGDKLTFSGAAVPPGKEVTFTFLVTENNPFNRFFYILLHPQPAPNSPPE